MKVRFDLVNESAVSFARDHGGELTRKWLLPELADSALSQLRALVVQAIQEGWSVRQLGAKIETAWGIARMFADTVAMTEIASAQENGNLIGWRQSQVVRAKRWVLGSEHKAADTCDQNVAAGEIPIDQPFPSGVLTPPAHAGCVCCLAAVTK